ncbi:MAG: hypothetical protein JSV54_06395 [Chloroflexota bacterium]|nr:MAG: hypothetical protein JSV54_06395 [Chloroflexota bacterium]
MNVKTEIRERPIPFSGEMVIEILDGRKTQTRRAIKIPPYARIKDFPYYDSRGIQICYDTTGLATFEWLLCPYGQVGDRLWVRETWATEEMFNGMSATQIEETKAATIPFWYKIHDFQLDREGQIRGRWRSPRFMPRWASRITLEITGVRVERLQEISSQEAKWEGIPRCCPECMFEIEGAPCVCVDMFRDIWDSLNAKRGYGWDTNPWVWVMEFRRTEQTTRKC